MRISYHVVASRFSNVIRIGLCAYDNDVQVSFNKGLLLDFKNKIENTVHIPYDELTAFDASNFLLHSIAKVSPSELAGYERTNSFPCTIDVDVSIIGTKGSAITVEVKRNTHTFMPSFAEAYAKHIASILKDHVSKSAQYFPAIDISGYV